jgi:flagellar biosynthesis/type III secretory pathway M-ring protein FliF/YscJ
MVNYDVILNLVSIVLILLILFMILFGCKSPINKRGYYERFSNKNEDDEEQEEEEEEDDDEKEEEKFENKEKKEDDKESKEQKPKKNKNELTGFESQILNQLSNGQLTTEGFTNLIATEKFTQKNLENIINHVEGFKNPHV